jgi:hypothetical protein
LLGVVEPVAPDVEPPDSEVDPAGSDVPAGVVDVPLSSELDEVCSADPGCADVAVGVPVPGDVPASGDAEVSVGEAGGAEDPGAAVVVVAGGMVTGPPDALRLDAWGAPSGTPVSSSNPPTGLTGPPRSTVSGDPTVPGST